MADGSAGGWCPATSSRPTRGPASSTWLRPSARSTARSAGTTNCPPSIRWAPTVGSPRRCPGWRASPSATPTRPSTTAWRRPASWSGAIPICIPYPHCWRCSTPLIYWGKPSWYIKTSERKADLVAQNQTIGWHPEHIRDGRMGEWLANNVDWALSRDRYWGTPLPVWRCDEGHVRCIGSRAELSALSGTDVSGVDPHRPAIDEVVFPCPGLRRRTRGGTHAAGGAGHRRLVRLRIDAHRPVGVPGQARVRRLARVPGRLHL